LNYRNSPLTQRNVHVHPDASDEVAITRRLILEQEETNSRRRNSPGTNSEDIQCPICLVEAELPVETNCGHLFCGEFYKKE
jgi:RING finger protein 170